MEPDITDVDIQNTVLELFARRGLKQGDVMWLSRLELFWQESTLRRSDLVVGIARLCSDESMVLSDNDGEIELWLTATGEAKASEILRAGDNYWQRYLREELLPSVRVSTHPARSDGRGRRSQDPYSGPL